MTSRFASQSASVGVKICGLTNAEDAEIAVAEGATFIGVILAGGPRLVALPQALTVLGRRREGVSRVAVFGGQSFEEVVDAARFLDLDVVQLHRATSEQEIAKLKTSTGCTVWPVVSLEGTVLPPDAAILARTSGHLLLDARVGERSGGTGIALDWGGLSAAVAELRAHVDEVQIILAGGLNAGNVATAIDLLRPDVADVSSGVESSPGRKDARALRLFLSAAGISSPLSHNQQE